MNVYGILVAASLFGWSAAFTGEKAEPQEEPAAEPDTKLTPEDERLPKERGFVISPDGPESSAVPREYSGKWIERDGARICDGYLTRFENEDYCSSEVPADWQPFEYDGKTYYIQPLADDLLERLSRRSNGASKRPCPLSRTILI